MNDYSLEQIVNSSYEIKYDTLSRNSVRGIFYTMKGVLTINNPYTGLLNIMQEQGKKYNSPTVCIGSVEKVQPLIIKTGDLLLDSDDILVSDILLEQYQRNISVDITGSISINGSGTITLNSYLRKGDVVAMMPTKNRQTYIVLCKVVKG